MAALPVPGLRTGMAAPSPELPSILREPSRVSAMLEKASRVPGCTERAGDTSLRPAGDPQWGHPAQGEGAPMRQGRAEQGLPEQPKEGYCFRQGFCSCCWWRGGYPAAPIEPGQLPWGRGSFALLPGSENTQPSQDSTHQRSAACPVPTPPIPSATLTRKEKQDSVDGGSWASWREAACSILLKVQVTCDDQREEI